jgi:phosphomannomutase
MLKPELQFRIGLIPILRIRRQFLQRIRIRNWRNARNYGVGTNRLNKYTFGQATQGLANYLHQQFSKSIKVAIAYDVRNNSKEFGKMCADVLTANGIKVLLFKEHRPTPELSFTVRDKKCNARNRFDGFSQSTRI